MSTFTDREGRSWKLTLTVGSLADIRRDAGVDLGASIRKGELADLLFTDPEIFVRVLWVLVAEQASAAGVTPEQFGHGFDGATLEAAGEAMMEAVADFFPRSQIGRVLKGRIKESLQKMDAAVAAKMDERFGALNNSAGDLPAS